jgi:hypothetical protein
LFAKLHVNQLPSFCVRASNDWQALSLVNHGSVVWSLNIEGIGEALTTVEALRLQDVVFMRMLCRALVVQRAVEPLASAHLAVAMALCLSRIILSTSVAHESEALVPCQDSKIHTLPPLTSGLSIKSTNMVAKRKTTLTPHDATSVLCRAAFALIPPARRR